MTINRIVSFLPSATELLYEFGLGGKIFGVTHECKYPSEASSKPQIIKSLIDSDKLTSKQINNKTCQLLNEKREIFTINEDELKKAEPDLIITQETCEVCAAYTNKVEKALEILQKKPILFSMDPHNLEEIISSITKLGKILKKEKKAKKITNLLEKRIQNIKEIKNENNITVLAIEWIDPFFTAGHWIPEMIEIAGGNNQVSRKGERSKQIDLQTIIEINPEMIIIMPCGFELNRVVSEYKTILQSNKLWNTLKAVKNNQIFAVNANSYFSKPSIRTIEGLEILAKIIQPKKFENIKISKNSFTQICK